MLSPQKFAEKTGLSYGQVLIMCKAGEINSIRSQKGHFKILEKELDQFTKSNDYISREKYENIVRENERLRNTIRQFQKYVENIAI